MRRLQKELPTTTSKAMIPKIEAGFAIRCGVVGDNQVGIVEVNRLRSVRILLILFGVFDRKFGNHPMGKRWQNKERLVYVNAKVEAQMLLVYNTFNTIYLFPFGEHLHHFHLLLF